MHCVLCGHENTPGNLRYYKPYPDQETMVLVCLAERICVMRFVMNAPLERVSDLFYDLLKTEDYHVTTK